MNQEPETGLDPTLYIGRLESDCPMQREAAAWSLGSMGHPRASRPLAGLLLREMRSIQDSGSIEHEDIVRAAADSIRRLGATESLYAVVRSLCEMGGCYEVERETVEGLVECLAEVGGLTVVREAADKVVSQARLQDDCSMGDRGSPGLETVGMVLFESLSMCGDAGVKTLQRLATAGPDPLKPLAQHALAMI